MDIFERIGEALFEGDTATVQSLTDAALADGQSPMAIMNEGLIPAMNRVGEAFEEGDLFLPGVLMAAQAMKAAMAKVMPLLKAQGGSSRGVVVVGTVQGDQHDIGKNLVAVLLEGAGFEVVDLGCDVPDEKFVEAAQQHGARLVGMSALLNNTMTRMKNVIKGLEAAGIKDRVKVMVGGAPLDEGFATEIGADGYAPDGVAAVQIAIDLLAS